MNLHTTDLPLVINREFYDDLIENFEAIEQQDDAQLIQETNDRLDKLDAEKATHDDVEELRQSLQQRINHLYAGDPQTIKTVVKEILEEEGVI